MSDGGTPGAPVRAGRAERSAHRRRARTSVALLVMVAVVAAAAWWAFGRSDGTPAAHPTPGGTGAVRSGNVDLLALSVTGPAPYLAIVGTGRGETRPAAIPIPSNLVVVVPGQGETPAQGVAALPGASIQVALSNVAGTWVENYATMSIPQLQAVVDRMGGLTVDLPEASTTTMGVIGPGSVNASGAQVAALLNVQGPGSDGRWQAVLSGWLAGKPELRRSDLTSVSELAGVQQVLDATTAAEVLPMPTRSAAGAAVIAAQPEFDALLSSTWGTRPPTPAIVQNGNGAPGVGESVGREIIPAGFRVVISQNATSFDVVHTDIIANGLTHVAEARRVRRAMGVGLVQASQVPSGIADITIVVGKDFTA